MADLAGRRVALVLGAGGARGLAHIGAIEAIEARHLRVVAIAGTSIGALVGGIHAAGRLPLYRDWASGLARGQVLRLLDFVFGHPGLIKGERLMAALAEVVGEHRIEDLPIPFTAVATDLASEREVWLTRGPLFDAIRASIAIPMVFTPHMVDGRQLIDGGLLAPVPITATRLHRSDLVIAVDVNARPSARFGHGAVPPPPAPVLSSSEPARAMGASEVTDSAGQGYRERLSALLDSMLPRRASDPTPAKPPEPGLLDLMSRALDTMQGQIARQQLAADPPDVLVRVPHDACFFYEFWRAREMIALGRRLTDEALDAAGL